MNRSPFANFRKPHELLSSAASMMPNQFSHSRSRNRSSGGSSVGSQPNLLVDSDVEEGEPISHSRSRSRGSPSKSRSRSTSPQWAGANATSVPLLPHNFGDSRSHSPYPPFDGSGEDVGLRIGEGTREQGFGSWFKGGKLGSWLWNTQKGWMVYIIFLIALYSSVSLALLIMNRFILWTGVYKFGYPITTTLLQLLFTQFFLFASASMTRSFSRSLHSLGLGCMVAPKPKPSKGKRRAGGGGLREFTNKLRSSTTGSIFEVKWREARLVLPLAVVYSLKIMLSNLSFAYTQLQIYQISRVLSLVWALILTHFFQRTQSLSVTTLSSCITMLLSLTVVSVRPGTRFAIEGFIAGFFSTFFVAAYPLVLSHTYKAFSARHNLDAAAANIFSTDLSGDGPLLSGDGKDQTRAAWKLLHYTNFLSVFFLLFCALVSGELRDISRNCYFLDVAFFWLMILGAGAAAWATFVAGFLLVCASSPLTMVVATYPRSALQTVLLMGFKLPTWSWVGVLMCWGSSVWYVVGRRRECGMQWCEEERERGRERRRSVDTVQGGL
ncbi:hypothetical protein FN846DRAFT_463976 [Sphaerosporella brunnea]|uniref:GDP-mannose transporter n=1 Tax=Sphaerosporella brunnea TaxID=1250544 RepID=A0A5J5F3Z1_9PEZI|nr:hypothetical protein FN846DRAFT_463976 [Sphaerosporella brunnea]